MGHEQQAGQWRVQFVFLKNLRNDVLKWLCFSSALCPCWLSEESVLSVFVLVLCLEQEVVGQALVTVSFLD